MKSNLKVFLLLAVVFLSSSSAALAQLAGWSNKVPLQIDENKGESVPYQIMFVELNTAALVSAGQMQANGDDIRFAIDCNGSQLVPYWIEAGMNTATTKIWLRLPAIAANTSVNVWLFTGNPGAAPGSSNSSVFQTTFATSGNFTLPVGTYDYDDFRVNAGDTLFVTGDGAGTILRINSGYMLVEGVIMANGQGFPGGLLSNGFGPGAGSAGPTSGAGGGGHGGVGGTGAYDTGDPINAGGITYGALGVATGTEAGSGGGGYDVLGGAGGGGVWLQTFEFSGAGGQVWVDGLDGIGDGQGSGGGSGGGAMLVADVVDFSGPIFSMSADGGDGGIGTNPANDDGGSGAGGIAKIYYYSIVPGPGLSVSYGPGAVGPNGEFSATQGGNGLGEINSVPGAFTYNLGAALTASDLNIISGDDTVCQGSIVQYVASTINGYNNSWSVLSGGNIVSGVGSNAVEVEWTAIGTHQLVAYATDPVSGCELTDTLTVSVSNTTVTTTITYTENCAGTPTAFSTSVAFDPTDTYSWDFGDGATSTDFNPTHIYASAGSYPVALTITTAGGCSVASTVTAVVPAEPTADFTFTTTTCPGEAVVFTNASTGATSYSWDFGDGVTDTSANPSHTYAGPGTYTVTLTSSATADCDATVTKSVTVSTTAGADFDFTSACPGDAVNFTDQSNIGGGTIDSLLWSFGDGNSATGATPTNVYAASGTYNVTLVVKTTDGCVDSVTKAVAVYDVPTASFAATTECAGTATSFTNTSGIATGTLSYNWAFGDGGSSTDINPTHTYLADGSYNVTLTATSNNGCVDDTIISVTVNEQPTSAFTIADASVCLGDTVEFTNTSTLSNEYYTWDFGDGNNSGLTNPTHLYTAPGVYTVTLTAQDSITGCEDVATATVTIFDEPIAFFTATTVCVGNTTEFTNGSFIPTGVMSFVWDLGDGNTSTDINPTHTYATAGTYNVLLTATSDNGCTDTVTVAVTVNPEPTSAFTIVDASVCFGDTVYFTNGSTAGADVVYAWDFGDGNTSTETDPAHLYAGPGVYDVTLALLDTVTGCTDTSYGQATVFDEPVAGFTATTVCEGSTTEFTNTTTIGTGTLSFVWDFADGSTSTDINPTHTYATAGDYDVLLTATSNNGCVDTITVTVTVNAEPISAFTIADASVCDGDTVYFTDGSTAGVDVVYTWDFGDGNTSTDASPAYLYAGPGLYDVFLALTDTITGCTDTAFAQVTVFDEPVAAFVGKDVCLGDPTPFTNNSTIGTGTLSYAWDFADGNTSTDINPTHTYTAAGDYDVILTVTSNNGCTDSDTVTVTVHPEPTSDFTAVDSTVCFGDVVEFVNNSSTGGDFGYAWDFGDGNTSTADNPTHLYGAPGLYNVVLAVTDTLTGCTDTSDMLIEVYHEPVAGFTGSDVCIGETVQFTSTSTLGVGTLSYAWDFGDGNTSTDINPAHTYDTIGIKTITLVVTTDNGCTDTAINTLIVYPEPVADFSAGPACFGFAVDFTNLTTIDFGTTTYVWEFGDGATDTTTNPSHVYPTLGVFTVTLTATSDAGCTHYTTQTVQINPNPSAAFTATTVCEGDATTFTNTSSVPSGTFTSFWDFGNGFTSLDDAPVYTYPFPGEYDVTLVVTSNHGCTDTIVHTVTVIPNPDADFLADPVCYGYEVDFTNVSSTSTGGGTIVDVKWFFGDGAVSLEANPSHLYDAPGSYLAQLIVTSSTGCIDTIKKAVVVHELPDSTIRPLGPTEFCDGDSVELSAAGGLTYEWSTGETTRNIVVKESGTYCVTVTTAFGCVADSCIEITKWELPPAYAGEDTTVSKGYLAYLHATGGVGYEWTPSDVLSDAFIADPTARPLETTQFIVLVTDTNGCQNTDSVTVFVRNDYLVEATNLITPNGDGKNDRWIIVNVETYPDVEVLIFDRWGTQVYSSKAYDNSWDGTYEGNDLPEGTYYYVLRFDGSERTYKGAINILR